MFVNYSVKSCTTRDTDRTIRSLKGMPASWKHHTAAEYECPDFIGSGVSFVMFILIGCAIATFKEKPFNIQLKYLKLTNNFPWDNIQTVIFKTKKWFSIIYVYIYMYINMHIYVSG